MTTEAAPSLTDRWETTDADLLALLDQFEELTKQWTDASDDGKPAVMEEICAQQLVISDAYRDRKDEEVADVWAWCAERGRWPLMPHEVGGYYWTSPFDDESPMHLRHRELLSREAFARLKIPCRASRTLAYAMWWLYHQLPVGNTID